MRVTVHEELCIGAGRCVVEAPEVFDQDEDTGVVILLDANPASFEAAEQAALLCPSQAITIGSD